MQKRLDSREALTALRERVRKDIEPRNGTHPIRITVHLGECGVAKGARDVFKQFAEVLDRESLHAVALCRGNCTDQCDYEPMVTYRDASGAEFRYGKLDRSKIEEIVKGHLLNGTPVSKYLITA